MTETTRPTGSQRFGSLTTLLHNIRKRERALAELEEVRKAVFGDPGDEPNVYANHDHLLELAAKMSHAIETLRMT
jgi:hypothetical protein